MGREICFTKCAAKLIVRLVPVWRWRCCYIEKRWFCRGEALLAVEVDGDKCPIFKTPRRKNILFKPSHHLSQSFQKNPTLSPVICDPRSSDPVFASNFPVNNSTSNNLNSTRMSLHIANNNIVWQDYDLALAFLLNNWEQGTWFTSRPNILCLSSQAHLGEGFDIASVSSLVSSWIYSMVIGHLW